MTAALPADSRKDDGEKGSSSCALHCTIPSSINLLHFTCQISVQSCTVPCPVAHPTATAQSGMSCNESGTHVAGKASYPSSAS